ncbi:MAG: polyphosphate kinase 1 [Saprospiraceae bacterium]|nr:polyphosphate kinase 1 [Saprospiraceae bacterium]
MSKHITNRDISWLSFNYRVLQEAKDPSVPLMERIKFLAIFSSNLDEFFRVRVAHLRSLERLGKKTIRELDFEPKIVLAEIISIIKNQQSEFVNLLNNVIIPELKLNQIYILRRLDLNEEQKNFIENYFLNNLLPFVQPVLLIKNKIRPFLNNGSLYISLWMKDKNSQNTNNQYAIIKLPSDHLPRFIQLPPSKPGKKEIIMLDDIVRFSANKLFPGYDIRDAFSIKLSRDAELYIDDEFSGDLVNKLKNSLTKRNVGPASRFVYDKKMPDHLLNFLLETFEISKNEAIPEGRYHNNSDFFGFPSFGNSQLKYAPLEQLQLPDLESNNIFENIANKDYLIHPPYHSFDSVINFFEQAANDPTVTHIKIIQYRVAKQSRIMNALMRAAKNGKKVSAFIEIKARFDEESNLFWGEQLEKAGVEVHYSFPGVKVHSKLALVRRIENEKPKYYAYLSTGNFHEDTSKIYTDLGIFTSKTLLIDELIQVFSFLETVKVPQKEFKQLLVGQFNLRESLEKMIQKEIQFAKEGLPASMTLKMNSLEDISMINLLYKASQAGVKIKLIIRGICCLIPGIPEISANIEAISIVDKFLEHSRVFIFNNNGDTKVYLSSADWMTRNLSYRVETAFPVLDESIKKTILELIDIQLNDTVKARRIHYKKQNEYRKHKDIPIRTQVETYYYLKRKLNESN